MIQSYDDEDIWSHKTIWYDTTMLWWCDDINSPPPPRAELQRAGSDSQKCRTGSEPSNGLIKTNRPQIHYNTQKNTKWKSKKKKRLYKKALWFCGTVQTPTMAHFESEVLWNNANIHHKKYIVQELFPAAHFNKNNLVNLFPQPPKTRGWDQRNMWFFMHKLSTLSSSKDLVKEHFMVAFVCLSLSAI